MYDLPSGTVTFLFTDIEGSTALLQRTRSGYGELLGVHNELLRSACAAHGGREMGTEGDAFFFVFERARDAIEAAVGAQLALGAHDWPPGSELRVRMGIHTGEPDISEEGYLGLALHRVARISDAGHGGQVLVSRATAELVGDELPPGVSLRDLGAHGLKDFERPQRIFQLVAEGLRCDFPPLRARDAQPARSISGALEDKLVRAHSTSIPVRAGDRSAPSAQPLHRRPLVLAMLAGVIAAAVSIPVFAVARDSPDGGGRGGGQLARTARLSDLRVEQVTYGEYRARLGASRSGIGGAVLSCPGVLVTYHVRFEGFRGADLPQSWQLFDASSGTRLAESHARMLRPTADRVEQDDQQFVPLPERAGRFRLVLQILAADGGAPIAHLSTGAFASTRARPPRNVTRPPLACIGLLAA